MTGALIQAGHAPAPALDAADIPMMPTVAQHAGPGGVLRHLGEFASVPDRFGPGEALLPPAVAAKARAELLESLRPAPAGAVTGSVAELMSSYVNPKVADPRGFVIAMARELALYPADIIRQAVREARRLFKFLPAIAEMVTVCDELIAPRRWQLRRVEAMELERARRRAEDRAQRRRTTDRDQIMAGFRQLRDLLASATAPAATSTAAATEPPGSE